MLKSRFDDSLSWERSNLFLLDVSIYESRHVDAKNKPAKVTKEIDTLTSRCQRGEKILHPHASEQVRTALILNLGTIDTLHRHWEARYASEEKNESFSPDRYFRSFKHMIQTRKSRGVRC